MQTTVVIVTEDYLAARETEEIKADPEALRNLAEAREAVREGDIVFGVDPARELVSNRSGG